MSSEHEEKNEKNHQQFISYNIHKPRIAGMLSI